MFILPTRYLLVCEPSGSADFFFFRLALNASPFLLVEVRRFELLTLSLQD